MAKDLLDLHGVREAEVDELVDAFLVNISNSNLKKARIMTGKGKGVVQKRVISYLKQAGYHWSYEKDKSGKANEGVLILHLD